MVGQEGADEEAQAMRLKPSLIAADSHAIAVVVGVSGWKLCLQALKID